MNGSRGDVEWADSTKMSLEAIEKELKKANRLKKIELLMSDDEYMKQHRAKIIEEIEKI